MDGLLLINKPVGITSFNVIRSLRRVLGLRRIGHAGTLDPRASGLLLVLLGAACKQANQFIKLDKWYRAELTLGTESLTGDSEGELTSLSNRQPTPAEIEAVLSQFRGPIEQTPPAYSAIKVDGRRAYQLARAGKSVDLPARTVTIYELNLLEYKYPIVRIEVHVSSGTYIRSLAADIGRVLGTGAYLSALVRTSVGEYRLSEAARLAEVTAENLHERLVKL